MGKKHFRPWVLEQHQIGAMYSALNFLVEKAKTASYVSLLSTRRKCISVLRKVDPCLAFRSVITFPFVMPPWGNHRADNTFEHPLGPCKRGPSAAGGRHPLSLERREDTSQQEEQPVDSLDLLSRAQNDEVMCLCKMQSFRLSSP